MPSPISVSVRLKALFEQPGQPQPAEDYYVIEARCDTFYVRREVAEGVLEALRRAWPPRWIEFVDLAGSGVRLRTRLIDCVQECTGAQRAAAREFRRARRREEKADRRPWEDDDEWW
jgi:hypothetical protein